MEIMLISLIAIIGFAVVMGLICTLNANHLAVKERLAIYTQDQKQTYLGPELEKSFRERILLVWVEKILGISQKLIPHAKKISIDKKLMAAGNPHGMHAEEFMVFKYAVLFLMLMIGFLLHNVLYLLLLVITGLFIPDLYLKANENKRKNAVLQGLPDILDLLSVSVEAGLSFDGALQKVVDKYSGPLTNEFEKSLHEINMGKPRREALRDMGERVNVDAVKTFLGSVIQADQLGVSISNVLKLQSQQVREDRRMRAEEKAEKAPVKMLLPLILFIFPTILIVLLGPAALRLMDTL